MRCLLNIHPDSPSSPVECIEADVVREGVDGWALSYAMTGRLADVRVPGVTNAERGDNLWQQTCFEAFVRPAFGTDYCEFNFSPSTRWATYRFTDYRSGISAPSKAFPPRITVQSQSDRFTLQASLRLADLLPRQYPWRLGLSAVIEDTDGRKSYWALAHPPGKPDFHHRDSFTVKLSPDASL